MGLSWICRDLESSKCPYTVDKRSSLVPHWTFGYGRRQGAVKEKAPLDNVMLTFRFHKAWGEETGKPFQRTHVLNNENKQVSSCFARPKFIKNGQLAQSSILPYQFGINVITLSFLGIK